MSDIDNILAQVPMGQLAAALGVDENEAEDAARTALPALLGGLQANAADPDGALSLGRALQDWQGAEDVLGADLDAIDTTDGSKIVQNIFGTNTDAVVAQLGGVRGGNSSLISKLLPILAPMVLAYLGKKLGEQGGLGDILGQVLGGGSQRSTRDAGSYQDSGSYQREQPSGPLIPTDGSSMSDVTHQGGSGAGSNPMGGVLGDILGQVLGGAAGGSSSSSSSTRSSGPTRSSAPDAGSIIDILGGLLGGGRR